MKYTFIILIVLTMFTIVHAEDGIQPVPSFLNPDVTGTTDIHNNDQYCSECHTQRPDGTGNKYLRFNDYSLTCRCHGYTSKKYRHPIGTVLSSDKRRMVPDVFPLEDGKITCNTCHQILMQCGDVKYKQKINKNFLRVDSSKERTAICYGCHVEAKYNRLNPHKQFDDDGNIIENKCRYCHKAKPDEKTATLKKQRAGEKGTVEFVAEFFRLCFRCHYNKVAAHLINANHITREPPAKIISNIHISEKELDVILPLDDEGGLTCATCHNPHQRGIIPFSSPASKGASENKRLRVPKAGNRICRACHRGH